MSLDIVTLALAKSYSDQHGGGGEASTAGDFIIKMTIEDDGDGGYTVISCDATVEQIDAAFNADKNIVLTVAQNDRTDKYVLSLVNAIPSASYIFESFLDEYLLSAIIYGGENAAFTMTLMSANAIGYSNATLPNVSTVGEALDKLVTKSHTHTNKSVLDKFAETDGKLTYDGKEIGGGSNVPVKINSWPMVQKMVRLGIAAEVFSVGDQLVCNHETYGTLVWDIIGIDHDTPANSKFKHSLTIQLHDCIGLANFQFDAAEPTNPNSYRKLNGSNNWLESGIRQWLNSDGDADTWWKAKTEYDAPPSYASSTAGFLKGLDAEFLSTVGEVSKITARDKVTDGGDSDTSTEKFFLLSKTEVYGGLNNNIAEGVAYPYYADNSVLSSAGVGADANRIKYRNGAAQNWWLRSPHDSYSSHVCVVYIKGNVNGNGVRDRLGVAPACCII